MPAATLRTDAGAIAYSQLLGTALALLSTQLYQASASRQQHNAVVDLVMSQYRCEPYASVAMPHQQLMLCRRYHHLPHTDGCTFVQQLGATAGGPLARRDVGPGACNREHRAVDLRRSRLHFAARPDQPGMARHAQPVPCSPATAPRVCVRCVHAWARAGARAFGLLAVNFRADADLLPVAHVHRRAVQTSNLHRPASRPTACVSPLRTFTRL